MGGVGCLRGCAVQVVDCRAAGRLLLRRPPRRLLSSSVAPAAAWQQQVAVGPFAKLRLTSNVSVRIRPFVFTDQEDIAAMQQGPASAGEAPPGLRELSEVHVFSSSGALPEQAVLVQADRDANTVTIGVSQLDASPDGRLEIVAPYTTAITAALTGPAGIVVEKLEAPLHLSTESGDLELKGCKGIGMSEVKSQTGNIRADSFTGDIDAQTGGTIGARKVQSLDARLRGALGVVVHALYSVKASLAAVSGPVAVGDAHGETTVETASGDVFIGSSDGSLTATTQDGDVYAHVLQNGTGITLATTSGEARCTVAPELLQRAELDLQTPTVVRTTGGALQLEVTAKTASLEPMEWFEAQLFKAKRMKEFSE